MPVVALTSYFNHHMFKWREVVPDDKNMTVNSDIVVVGVDWGTTHRRAYGLDNRGQCIAEYSDSAGAMASRGRFPAALKDLLLALRAQPESVVMAGMVGSAFGWQAVPYVDGNVALQVLTQHTQTLLETGVAAHCAIVPGYCVRDAQAQPDVMRGEETQLLGACCLGHRTGWFVLPGTHSKWVELRDGHVLQLRTYMTGELFDVLGSHGTLAVAAGGAPAVWSDVAFASGVQAAAHGILSHQLVACRAKVVAGDIPAGHAHAYLSGLLIGCEMRDFSGATGTSPLRLIGSPALAKRYLAAADLLGLRMDVLDARAAFIAAIHHLHQTRTLP